jgi:hypothetical protein
MPTHYARRESGVLDIFSEYSLKIPQIYSNMLDILDISLLGRRGGLIGGPGGWAGTHTTLIPKLGFPGLEIENLKLSFDHFEVLHLHMIA